MFALKKLLSALVLPPFGLVLLALSGLWLARRRPRLGHGVACLALLALALLSLPPVAQSLMHSLETSPPISAQQFARAEAIVILGGGSYAGAPEYRGDTVNRWTLERIRYGAYLQKRRPLPILVTGGAPFGGRAEGVLMKEAIERDFRGQVVWVESASRDTAENAAYSALILKPAGIKRIALVSNAWHLRRAIELFERQGFEVFPASTGYTTASHSFYERMLPSADALEKSYIALHEWLGILVQRMTD